MDSQEPDALYPKGTSVFKGLPKPIRSLTSDVAEPGEVKINQTLYNVFNAYVMSYVASPGLRSGCKSMFGKKAQCLNCLI